MSERTQLENLLLRERWIIGVSLALVIALCWGWIAPMAVDMYGPMTGWSAWMMTRNWDVTHILLLFAMWTVMMVGMMLPSATPALFLYAGVIRKSPEGDRVQLYVYAFAAGYLLVWTGFSVVATVLQLVLARWLLITSMMEASNRWFAFVLLLIAAAYQLTPWKRACLKGCRSPLMFITQHWRRGIFGGFRIGVVHGLSCLGCCWALMLLLFVGGVMNLWWIGALTVFVLIEKLVPLGRQGGRVTALLIFALALWVLVRR